MTQANGCSSSVPTSYQSQTTLQENEKEWTLAEKVYDFDDILSEDENKRKQSVDPLFVPCLEQFSEDCSTLESITSDPWFTDQGSQQNQWCISNNTAEPTNESSTAVTSEPKPTGKTETQWSSQAWSDATSTVNDSQTNSSLLSSNWGNEDDIKFCPTFNNHKSPSAATFTNVDRTDSQKCNFWSQIQSWPRSSINNSFNANNWNCTSTNGTIAWTSDSKRGTVDASTTASEPVNESMTTIFHSGLGFPDKCAGCQSEIQLSSLAIRVRQLHFHVNCVRCNSCGVLLKKGDFFGMNEESLYCYAHYYQQNTRDRTNEPEKNKRTRTSFKHDQLTIMRHHFKINQRPKSPELRMIAQKTGLDKKTLQVMLLD